MEANITRTVRRVGGLLFDDWRRRLCAFLPSLYVLLLASLWVLPSALRPAAPGADIRADVAIYRCMGGVPLAETLDRLAELGIDASGPDARRKLAAVGCGAGGGVSSCVTHIGGDTYEEGSGTSRTVIVLCW